MERAQVGRMVRSSLAALSVYERRFALSIAACAPLRQGLAILCCVAMSATLLLQAQILIVKLHTMPSSSVWMRDGRRPKLMSKDLLRYDDWLELTIE